MHIMSAGCRTAQATPSSVCLYRTLTSRHARKKSRSRKCHSSAKLMSCQPVGGRMTLVGAGSEAVVIKHSVVPSPYSIVGNDYSARRTPYAVPNCCDKLKHHGYSTDH